MKVHELMPPKEERTERKEKLKFVAAYDFTDEHGHLLFQKVRFVNQDGVKTFRQRKPDENGEWIYSLGETPKVLYNLPGVLAAKAKGEPIWVVEGEKDANTLIEMGLCATTMPGVFGGSGDGTLGGMLGGGLGDRLGDGLGDGISGVGMCGGGDDGDAGAGG